MSDPILRPEPSRSLGASGGPGPVSPVPEARGLGEVTQGSGTMLPSTTGACPLGQGKPCRGQHGQAPGETPTKTNVFAGLRTQPKVLGGKTRANAQKANGALRGEESRRDVRLGASPLGSGSRGTCEWARWAAVQTLASDPTPAPRGRLQEPRGARTKSPRGAAPFCFSVARKPEAGGGAPRGGARRGGAPLPPGL
jgi:hypothetical protein